MKTPTTIFDGYKTSQTVFFEAIYHYNYLERSLAKLPLLSEPKYFLTLEEMIFDFRKAKKARANKDKPTSGKYRMILSDHGKEACKDPSIAEKHSSVDTWFNI